MANTSGQFNLVEVTGFAFADADLVAGVIPTSPVSLAGLIKDGTVNVDFPAPSITSEYDEINQSVYRVRVGQVQNKVTVQLVTSRAAEIYKFWGKSLTAGTAGTTPDKLEISGKSAAVNKYVKITGKNIEGKVVTLELLNAKPVSSWSGNMGTNQDTIGLSVVFYLIQSADGSGDQAIISPAF
jgi:hypothetical protein